MSSPIPGKEYVVRSGDTISKIAVRAYGDQEKWRMIYAANQTTLRSRNPEIIFPGEVLKIPKLPERELLESKLVGTKPGVITIFSGQTQIPVYALRAVRSINTAANAWSGNIHRGLRDANPSIKKAVSAYSYAPCDLFIGEDLVMTTLLYNIAPSINESGSFIAMEAFSPTVDIVDSVVRPPFEVNGLSLLSRAKQFLDPAGIAVEVDPAVRSKVNAAIPRMTASDTEKQFDHLAKIAKQQAVLISCLPTGKLYFTEANVKGKPVATLVEGEDFQPSGKAGEFAAHFKGRERFNTYRALHNSPWGSVSAVSKDNVVPSTRSTTIKMDETVVGGLPRAADWERNKAIAKTLEITIPVKGFYNKSGALWVENTQVTVKSPTMFIPDGFNFLIKSVEYIQDDSGQTTVLSLVPPQVYSGGVVQEPWRVL